MARRPRPWFTPDQQQRWHARLATAKDPEHVVIRLIAAALAEDIFRAFRFAGEPEFDRVTEATYFAGYLSAAVVNTLGRRSPEKAARGTAVLLRTRSKEALWLAGRACAWTTDRLLEDLRAGREGPLHKRVLRVLLTGPPRLPPLQPGSRPAWLGVSYPLWVVAVHDDIRDDLRAIFPTPKGRARRRRGRSTAAGAETRRAAGPTAWHDTPAKTRQKILGKQLGAGEFSADVLDTAGNCELRSAAVHVLTGAVVGLAEETVRRLVRRTRPLAEALDDADRRAGRQ
jgi:hypothetical protein